MIALSTSSLFQLPRRHSRARSIASHERRAFAELFWIVTWGGGMPSNGVPPSIALFGSLAVGTSGHRLHRDAVHGALARSRHSSPLFPVLEGPCPRLAPSRVEGWVAFSRTDLPLTAQVPR